MNNLRTCDSPFEVSLHIILKADKEKNAKVVLACLNKVIAAQIEKTEPYPKGGTSVHLKKEIEATTWNDAVVQCIELAQAFGNGWEISGAVEEEIDLVSGQLATGGQSFSISGIAWAHIHIAKNNARSH